MRRVGVKKLLHVMANLVGIEGHDTRRPRHRKATNDDLFDQDLYARPPAT
jgi:hypothetical protein